MASKLAWLAATVLALAPLAGGSAAIAQDKGLDNAHRAPYYDSLAGKRVVFLPIAMGFDLTEGWAAIMRKQAEKLGYSFEIRDPAWSTEAGTRAMTTILNQKPDLIVVHNPDVQSYARLLQRAEQAGIKVLQINMESAYQTDSYVGADWVNVGEAEAEALVRECSPGKGSSNKVAIMQGAPNGAADLYQMRGYFNVFDAHPEIEVVAVQVANYDSAKARSIMETILQQHPDLCGVVGNWDGQDVGTGAAVQEAGLSDQVYVVTSGGGNETACENLRKGLFDEIVSYSVPTQGILLNQQIAELLQLSTEAGERKVTYFSPLTSITKDNANATNCWTLEQLQ